MHWLCTAAEPTQSDAFGFGPALSQLLLAPSPFFFNTTQHTAEDFYYSSASDNRFAQSSMRQMKAGLEPARSLLIAPVFADDPDGGGVVDGDMGPGKKVVGVVEMVNKKNERGAVVAFNSDDEKLVRMLAHHSSTFIHLDDD